MLMLSRVLVSQYFHLSVHSTGWTASGSANCIDAGRSTYDPGSQFFASCPEQLNGGIGQKILLYHQFPDLRMQLLNLRRAHLFRCRAASRKSRRHVLNRGPFSHADLVRMHAVLLGQRCQRHLFTDRFKRDSRLEFR